MEGTGGGKWSVKVARAVVGVTNATVRDGSHCENVL